MAYIAWTGSAMAQFSPEERECAAAGGMWDRQSQTCTMAPQARPLPVIPVITAVPNEGVIDPQQMFDDGFVYVNGKWVRANDPEVIAYANRPVSQGGRAGMSAVPGAQTIQGASVLGTIVPVAPAVLLPSFVGGNLGRVELGKGMRPESGGTERVRIGTMPIVRGLA